MRTRERQVHNILLDHNPYYAKLIANLQTIFRKRCYFFMRKIKFRGGDGFDINIEHTVAISGAFIQISFGLNNYLLKGFEMITIYQKAYKSTVTGMFHKGDVNPNGAIAISWEDFIQGYKTDEDNLNVGLHEMAHAWFFSISRDRFYSEDNQYDLLSKFIFLSEDEVMRIRKKRKSIFRKYASENVYEFFAVSIEYFFEDAVEFKAELPNLYRHLCLLLNQDPAENKFTTFDVDEYFSSKNLYKELNKFNAVSIEEQNLNIHTHFRLDKKFLVFLFIWISLLSIGFYHKIQDDTYYLIIFLVPILGYIYLAFINGRETVSVATEFIVFQGRRGFNKYIQAVSYDNILTVNINRQERVFIMKYMDEGKVRIKYLSSYYEHDYIHFIHLLGHKKVVLKNAGTRVPRIKSRNRWRKQA